MNEPDEKTQGRILFAIKVAAFLAVGYVVWLTISGLWSLFCHIDFNPILLP